MAKEQENALAIFSRGSQLLAEATTVQKAKELKDLGITAGEWARRKGMGEEAVAQARAFAFDAEYQMGVLLRESERNKGAKGSKVTGNHRAPVKDDAPTLADLGITKKESSAAQKLLSLPKRVCQKVRDGLMPRTAALRLVREQKREKARQENAAKVTDTERIEDLNGVFSTFLVDPPWSWEDEGDVNQLGRAKPDYATMTIQQLTALPVDRLAAKDAHIYCWVTNRSLPKVFGLLEAWDFRYITLLTWPKPSFGMGNYFRGQTEHIAFGVRGSLSLSVKDASTLLPTWPRGKGHSTKPPEVHSFIERCSPGPYLELFARQQTAGWTVWGCDV